MESKPKQHAISLLLLTKTAQNQNGLKQSDYARYHQYCTRRMLRLRKQLNFTQHQMLNKKSIYAKREVTKELVSEDVRFL